MFYIDDEFLSDVGLARLAPDLKERYREAISDRLKDSVMTRIDDPVEVGIDLEEFLDVLEEEHLLARIELATSAADLLALEELAALEPEANTTSNA